MKATKSFKAIDGTLFESKEKCVQYESIRDTKKIVNDLFKGLEAGRDSDHYTPPSQDDMDYIARAILMQRKNLSKIFSRLNKVKPVKK